MYASDENKVVSLGTLFAGYKPEKKKRTSERAELIRYFAEKARDRNGKPFKPSYIAYRLSHLTVSDLYTFRSMLEDRAKTQQGFNWNRAFFGMLKAQSLSTP